METEPEPETDPGRSDCFCRRRRFKALCGVYRRQKLRFTGDNHIYGDRAFFSPCPGHSSDLYSCGKERRCDHDCSRIPHYAARVLPFDGLYGRDHDKIILGVFLWIGRYPSGCTGKQLWSDSVRFVCRSVPVYGRCLVPVDFEREGGGRRAPSEKIRYRTGLRAVSDLPGGGAGSAPAANARADGSRDVARHSSRGEGGVGCGSY